MSMAVRCAEGQDDHPGQDDPYSVCWCMECSCNAKDDQYTPGISLANYGACVNNMEDYHNEQEISRYASLVERFDLTCFISRNKSVTILQQETMIF